MRKIILVMLTFLLFLPLTLHGSSAYFTDTESVGISISAAEDSPFYHILLSSDGATEFDPRVSEGVNSTFEVHLYKDKYYQNICIGKITNLTSGRVRININPYDKELEDYVNFSPISNSWIDSGNSISFDKISTKPNKLPASPPEEGYDVSFRVSCESDAKEYTYTFKVFVHN